MPTVLTPLQHVVFVDLTSALAVLGGLLLWTGFVLIGLIARRLEQAYGHATHWQYFIVAPSGAVIYLIMQAVASLRHQNMNAVEQWIGYALLVWSAGLLAWGLAGFRRTLERIARET